MRKIISFGISAMLVLVAVAMWAVAQTKRQDRSGIAKPKIATFELMVNAKDLPAQGYDAF